MSEEANEPQAQVAPKRMLPFFPPLLALFPIFGIWSGNLELVPISHVWRPAIVMMLVTCLVWLVFAAVFRNAVRGGIVATTSVLGLYAFDWARTNFPVDFVSTPGLITYAVGCVIVGLLISVGVRNAKIPNALAVFSVIIGLSQVAFGYMKVTPARDPAKMPPATNASTEGSPDIYYVILDGYGRHDSVLKSIGYDNSWFIDELKKRGFYVAEEAHSNYCQTQLSVASSLNLDYIPPLVPTATAKTNDRTALAALTDLPESATFLKSKGYYWCSITSGFPGIQFAKADVQLTEEIGMTMVEQSLMHYTPYAYFKVAQSQFDDRRSMLKNAFKALANLPDRKGAPRFVTAHILAPHPPFVFDQDGNPIRQANQFSIVDGSDYMMSLKKDDYRAGYSGQVAFVSKQALAAVDSILKKSGPRPIIILQGDHGSKVGLDQTKIEKTDLNECFPNLNAYLVPDEVKSQLKPEMTPVNSFRLIFTTLFGAKYPPLPNTSYYSPFDFPYNFTEVTKRLVPAEKIEEEALKPNNR